MKSRLITYSILLPASLFVLVLGTREVARAQQIELGRRDLSCKTWQRR